MPEVNHVLIFENKGKVVGVSNPHPHNQIYATNFVFKTIAIEVEAAARHWQDEPAQSCSRTSSPREKPTAGGSLPKTIRRSRSFHISPATLTKRMSRRSNRTKASPICRRAELADLAAVLQNVLVRFDNLWRISFPYVLVLHQAPTDGRTAEGFHFHIEIHPPLRTPNLLKHLAGPEIGGGNFLSDTSPEEKAAELRSLSDVHYKTATSGNNRVTTAADFIEPLRRLHDWIRGLVVTACEERSADDLTRVAHDGAGDVIYAIDRISETALVDWFNREIAAHEPIILIGEGLPNGRMTLPSRHEGRRRPLAHDRRSDRRHARPDVPKTARLDSHRRRAQPRRRHVARRYRSRRANRNSTHQATSVRPGSGPFAAAAFTACGINRLTGESRPLTIEPSPATELTTRLRDHLPFFSRRPRCAGCAR